MTMADLLYTGVFMGCIVAKYYAKLCLWPLTRSNIIDTHNLYTLQFFSAPRTVLWTSPLITDHFFDFLYVWM